MSAYRKGFQAAVPEIKAKVILTCNGNYHDADAVEFLDIHSDMSERDVMTFNCPICQQTHQSLILT